MNNSSKNISINEKIEIIDRIIYMFPDLEKHRMEIINDILTFKKYQKEEYVLERFYIGNKKYYKDKYHCILDEDANLVGSWKCTKGEYQYYIHDENKYKNILNLPALNINNDIENDYYNHNSNNDNDMNDHFNNYIRTKNYYNNINDDDDNFNIYVGNDNNDNNNDDNYNDFNINIGNGNNMNMGNDENNYYKKVNNYNYDNNENENNEIKNNNKNKINYNNNDYNDDINDDKNDDRNDNN